MGILEVNNLKKSFGAIHAVKDISFSVEVGEIFTIIGPNGAGKTTTLEMIEGLQKPDFGTVEIKDLEWKKHEKKIKQMIGIQPQSSALFDLLTVYENLDVFSSFYEKKRPIEEILHLINLQDHRKQKVKALSGGQKQRLTIGLAMVNDPDLIFLDEPTTGLDPQARMNVWDIILSFKKMGKTIILTTHYMEEASKLSDRVCIVDQGKIIAIDTPKNLINQLTHERKIQLLMNEEITDYITPMINHLKEHESITEVQHQEHLFTITSTHPDESLYHILHYTRANNLSIEQVSIDELDLEDVFITYTGKEWRD
ncbi:ABC transporter ATP-binding protein [Longirhabdus pacifica]|uniref:ABC transporter ATP-binding protein n=1 Tax=Longirhabdus pacifica TaxID=2305227 RepID=UPI00100881EE|nr:ABC transporter ATP-binding protein [Longirhabdus pacifica]